MICPHCKKAIPDDKRTLPQNNAMHLWFTQIEMHCWERGLTLDKLYKEPAEVPITREYLKEFFKLTVMLMYNKHSTTQLTKRELSKVVEVCQKVFAERLDYTGEFPSIESAVDNLGE